MEHPVPLEEAVRTASPERSATIGLPATRNIFDHRFALTPEGAARMVERGFRVCMESGAAAGIHYPDEAYARSGVEIVERGEAFAADIVIYLSALNADDVRRMKRGALLLGFRHCDAGDAAALNTLIERKVIYLALENIRDDADRRIFGDMLREIDGRAAMAVGSSLLADAVHGKGILLGGVAGVVPCEVMVIGADLAGVAAARTAIGSGATVRIFDNNTYRLREALSALGGAAIGSCIHPKVFDSALAAADIVVAADTGGPGSAVGADAMRLMKRGVIAFDITEHPGSAFPAMQLVNLDLAQSGDTSPDEPTRLCYINAGNAVPRTVAMGISNSFVAMMDDILVCEGVTNALKLKAGLRRAAITFLGLCTDGEASRAMGCRAVDINLYLHFS